MADDFFRAFRREVEMPVVSGEAPGPVAAAEAAVNADAHATAKAPTSREAVDHLMVQALSNERWTWLAIAVAVAATGLLMLKR